MRLEFNPRALCYNLYCDTHEEYDKMKQLMERPLTATDLKSIDNMMYADTDSIKVHTDFINRNSFYGLSVDEKRYIHNDVLVTKNYLNLLYGRANMMNNYILIHNSDRPIVIFKQHIVAIRKAVENEKAEIQTVDGYIITSDEDYATVVKLIF